MPPKAYLVTRIHGSDRREVACLSCEQDRDIDAAELVASLDEKKRADLRRKVFSSFDLWIAFVPNPKRWHGWNEDGYRHCIVFKWSERDGGHRLYGFTCHPVASRPDFQVSVLVSHRTKNEAHTDPKEKTRAERLRLDANVIAAIKKAFAEKEERKKPWVH